MLLSCSAPIALCRSVSDHMPVSLVFGARPARQEHSALSTFGADEVSNILQLSNRAGLQRSLLAARDFVVVASWLLLHLFAQESGPQLLE